MTLVDRSIANIRRAVKRIGKKPMADRIGATDSLLRDVMADRWNPTASTLRALEEAAKKVNAVPEDVQ